MIWPRFFKKYTIGVSTKISIICNIGFQKMTNRKEKNCRYFCMIIWLRTINNKLIGPDLLYWCPHVWSFKESGSGKMRMACALHISSPGDRHFAKKMDSWFFTFWTSTMSTYLSIQNESSWFNWTKTGVFLSHYIWNLVEISYIGKISITFTEY